MKLHLVEKQYEYGDETPLIFLGDTHVGNPTIDRDKLRNDIDEIAQMDDAVVFLMADLAEYIDHRDKRFSHSSVDPYYFKYLPDLDQLAMVYIQELIEWLRPIADKIAVAHKGNHEDTMEPQLKPMLQILKNLEPYGCNAVYAPGRALTRINWEHRSGGARRSLLIDTAHGNQAGRKRGAKSNRMIDMFSYSPAHVIARGHSHDLFMGPGPPLVEPNPSMTKVRKRQRYCGHSGSYFESDAVRDESNYAEDADLPPQQIGHARVYARVDKTVTLRGEVR